MKDIKVHDEEENNVNCSCDNEESQFFQDHGCCEWCYFIG